MKYSNRFSVLRMCQVLGVSTSGYYDWKKAPETKRMKENRELLKVIKDIHDQSNKRYGSPKVYIELMKRGFSCGHNRVARIMRENGIKSKVIKKYRPRGKVIQISEASDNILNRQFSQNNVDQVWATDITYIKTLNGWVYLCVFIDLCSKAVVGWSIDNHMKTELVLDALEKACMKRRPQRNLLIHSDQGTQYGSDDFRQYLKYNNFKQSMSRRGNCWDNACVESFFKLLKVEELNDYKFNSLEEVKYIIFKYIEYFYNRKRIHSSIGYLAPLEYEKKLCA